MSGRVVTSYTRIPVCLHEYDECSSCTERGAMRYIWLMLHFAKVGSTAADPVCW